jgi:aldose 1-epimerase
MLREPDNAALATGSPLMLASFPLVPYSNRIGNARFNWNGRDVRLVSNFAPEPHAIHGIGWRRPWQAARVDAHGCTLTLEHAGDEHWPFAFAATQSFALRDGALNITLTAINRADQPVPLAFGHHPYLDQNGASLRFNANAVIMNAFDALPLDPAVPDGQFDFHRGCAVVGRAIDNCYSGWDGHAQVCWAGRPLTLEIRSDMTAAVVYIPKGGAAFCFEPVPHINNALNRPDLAPAMPLVQPGEAFVSTIELRAV